MSENKTLSPSSNIYYKRFELIDASYQRFYCYLLRNISFYSESSDEAIANYEKCSSYFKDKDPVNYYRTVSNYLCWLIKNRNEPKVSGKLSRIVEEAEEILEFNSADYSYLNINYGLYLMLIDKNPRKYFESIRHESDTTETPYIYAQINLALYEAKHGDTDNALNRLDVLTGAIKNVSSTEAIYNINRALVEFIHGELSLSSKSHWMKSHTRRGEADKALVRFEFYQKNKNAKNKVELANGNWDILFEPGYIFYRTFNADELLSAF
jgi:hypothetical protein